MTNNVSINQLMNEKASLHNIHSLSVYTIITAKLLQNLKPIQKATAIVKLLSTLIFYATFLQAILVSIL